MKFSREKKAKMRKYRERRIRKNTGFESVDSQFKNMNTGEEFLVDDVAMFGGNCYLLAYCFNPESHVILKKIHECESESVKLSPKKVLENKKAFENSSTWFEHSKVTISDKGFVTNILH